MTRRNNRCTGKVQLDGSIVRCTKTKGHSIASMHKGLLVRKYVPSIYLEWTHSTRLAGKVHNDVSHLSP